MARSWQYPRWRRLAMQGALWLVLGATLGLAALVARQRQIPLDEPREYGDLSVRLPAGWAVSAASAAQSPLIVQAKEPAVVSGTGAGGGRTLTVLRQRTRGLLPPLQYLLYSDWLKGREESYQRQRVGGWPGVRIGGTYLQRLPGGEERQAKQLLACTVLPSDRAITIVLEGIGPLTSADQRIVQQVAEAIRIKDEEAMPEPGGAVQLPGGIAAGVPEGFVALRSNDPNRIERQLLLDDDAEGWGVIELVPCLILSQEPSQAGHEAARLLALRDPLWAQARIDPAGPGRWTIQPVDDDEAELFPVRAHLLSDGSGQALLLIFRAGLRGGEWFDRAWRDLADSATFTRPIDLRQMETDGVEQARQWREAGLARLVPTGEQDEWWLWYNERFDHYIGWSHLSYQVSPPAEFAGVRETRWRVRGSGDGLLQAIHRWTSNNDLLSYTVEMEVRTAAPAAAAPPARFTWAATQRTTLAQGTLTMALTGAGGSNHGPTTTPATAPAAVAQTLSRAAPDNYVPGAWLPLLLGTARIDRPILLQTEWLVGEEARSSSELLTLIVRPSEEGAPRATREATPAPTTDPAADGVRSLLVQVNGSGQASRWWFAPDGTVTKIDLAAGTRRVRSEREGIRRNFESDPRMVP